MAKSANTLMKWLSDDENMDKLFSMCSDGTLKKYNDGFSQIQEYHHDSDSDREQLVFHYTDKQTKSKATIWIERKVGTYDLCEFTGYVNGQCVFSYDVETKRVTDESNNWLFSKIVNDMLDDIRKTGDKYIQMKKYDIPRDSEFDAAFNQLALSMLDYEPHQIGEIYIKLYESDENERQILMGSLKMMARSEFGVSSKSEKTKVDNDFDRTFDNIVKSAVGHTTPSSVGKLYHMMQSQTRQGREQLLGLFALFNLKMLHDMQ